MFRPLLDCNGEISINRLLGSQDLSEYVVSIRTFQDVVNKLNIIVSSRLMELLHQVDVDVALDICKNGSYLYKFPNSYLRKKHFSRCHFEIDLDSGCIKWFQKKKALFCSRKLASVRTLYLSDVSHILPGFDSDFWRSKKLVGKECINSSFGIELVVVGNRSKTLRLLCANKEEWKLWMVGLLVSHALAQREKLASKNKGTKKIVDAKHFYTHDYIRRQWELSDLDNSGSISFSEFMRLTKRLQMPVSKDYTHALFCEYDKDCNDALDYKEFRNLLTQLLILPELRELFDEYKDPDTNVMNASKFRNFLIDVQGMDPSSSLESLVNAVMNMKEPFIERGGITEIGFNILMSSEFNSAFDPLKRDVYQSMDEPISHYWIASSHNTYLTGDQLTSKSEIGQYITVLLQGCRCVELDVWNGPDGSPIIYHGHTLTSKVYFEDVIRACKDYAFQISPYPIILSLEMHASDKQREKVAEIILRVLGDSLYIPSNNDNDRLPTPNELRYKFLVKAKIPKEDDLTFCSNSEIVNEDNDNEANSDIIETNLRSPNGISSKHEIQELHSNKTPMRRRLYSSLISLPGNAIQLSNFENRRRMSIGSLVETKFLRFARDSSTSLAKFHQDHLCRVYPSGTRISSSNYNPLIPWSYGAQIVALNYQAVGTALLLNEGRFRQNGGAKSGYVLKPNICLRKCQDGRVFDPMNPLETLELFDIPPVRICIQIISAHQLPDNLSQFSRGIAGIITGNKLSPYITISVFGGPSEEFKSYRTPAINNNGFNPRWENLSPFTFNVICPEISIINFEVRSSDSIQSEFIAAASIPVSCLRPGLRWIQLFDSNFIDIQCCGILANISITTELPKTYMLSSILTGNNGDTSTNLQETLQQFRGIKF
ncbi:phospholipase C-like protein [Cryptosporidium canis]|uniref:Phosphoinositide phospholipase C n=1 Tax=Cryptosporidium canis TaxID=195482 RepID=A0ABQ8P5I0_9CRYT|nr:phospholipase C-like protein [Cryptosporidium canis]KAJ1613469.1 phospholipase C-like protein [Cryptosporidium canis]